MKNMIRFGLLAGLLSLQFVGCATKNTTQTRINALEAQLGVMTDEVARLDQSLQEVRASLAQTQGSPYGGSGKTSGNTALYRTPSGFELPAADIQKALKGAGYYKGTVDGKIGIGTKNAVKAFQKDHGMEADGVVGRGTWNKLKVYLGSSN